MKEQRRVDARDVFVCFWQ